jgi:glycosyltransferase involved in cell wall biosynthesis
LVKDKGIHVILDAFDKLPKDKFTLRFVGGRGEMEAVIRKHPEFGKRITLDPWMDYEKLPEIYSQADISLMPSIDSAMWIEQCGYAVGESLLCHTPVVTSFSKSIMELWKMPDVSFISQNDSEALLNVLSNPKVYRQAKKGRQATIEKYSLEKVGQKYIDIFSENI